MRYNILFILLLFTGCTMPVDKSADYESARRATIDAWEEIIEPVSNECYSRSKNVIITESNKFPESCIPPDSFGKYIGCYLETDKLGIGGDMIYLLDSRTELQKMDTAVHEFTHLLSNCEFGKNKSIDIELLIWCVANYLGDDVPNECADIPGDYFHLDKRLWDKYGANTVEAVGCANLSL